MSRIIGDRKEKSALDEMEEVARARNADVAEEERLEAERKAREEAERKEKGIPETPAGNIITADYHRVKWDSYAPRVEQGGEKIQYEYNGSLERLKKDGKRHPLPSEALSLTAAHLEGKLTDELRAVDGDMLSGYGEWLSMVFERKGNILVAYSNPEGMIWDGKEYAKQNDFKFDAKQEFGIERMPSDIWVDLNHFNEDFVLLMCGRKFEDLPQQMKSESGMVRVYLPAEGIAWPVSRGPIEGYRNGFNIAGSYCHVRASRGVKEKTERMGTINGIPIWRQ